MFARRTPRLSRPLALAAAAALALGVGLAGPAGASSSSPTPAPSKVTFTVGILGDIDSANPFTGIVAEAYEIFQMEYPTLTEYSATDFSPAPGLAESWQESADKKTWTYKIRSGLTWSDGEPLTAKDAAYTFNRIINGEYEQTNYGSYVENITKAEAPDDTTLVLTVSKPSPIMEKLYVYILPQHIWEKIDEKAVKSYKNEGTEASPTVGGRPVRDDRAQDRPVHPDAGQPQLLRRQAGRRRGRVQDLHQRRRARPGAEEGRDRLRRLARGERLQVAGEHRRASRPSPRIYSGFDELAFNTGAALDDGTPIGDGNPLLKDKKLRQALGWAIDRQALVDKVLGGGGSAGLDDHPADVHRPAPRPGQPGHLRPGEGQAAARRRGLPRRLRTACAPTPRATSSRSACWRAASRRRPRSRSQFIKGYFAAVGVEIERQGRRPRTRSPRSSARATSTCSSGAGSSSPTRTTSSRRSPARTGRTRTATRSTPTCPTRSTATRSTTSSTRSRRSRPTRPSAPRSSSRCSSMLYDDSPYLVTYYYDNHEAYRSDRFTGFVAAARPERLAAVPVRHVDVRERQAGHHGRAGPDRRAAASSLERTPTGRLIDRRSRPLIAVAAAVSASRCGVAATATSTTDDRE